MSALAPADMVPCYCCTAITGMSTVWEAIITDATSGAAIMPAYTAIMIPHAIN